MLKEYEFFLIIMAKCSREKNQMNKIEWKGDSVWTFVNIFVSFIHSNRHFQSIKSFNQSFF